MAHQVVADHESQDRVAQEFQLFVVAQGVAVGATSRRPWTYGSEHAQHLLIAESVP